MPIIDTFHATRRMDDEEGEMEMNLRTVLLFRLNKFSSEPARRLRFVSAKNCIILPTIIESENEKIKKNPKAIDLRWSIASHDLWLFN